MHRSRFNASACTSPHSPHRRTFTSHTNTQKSNRLTSLAITDPLTHCNQHAQALPPTTTSWRTHQLLTHPHDRIAALTDQRAHRVDFSLAAPPHKLWAMAKITLALPDGGVAWHPRVHARAPIDAIPQGTTVFQVDCESTSLLRDGAPFAANGRFRWGVGGARLRLQTVMDASECTR
jgi:hypothetical protein